jgi:hypothetical protein
MDAPPTFFGKPGEPAPPVDPEDLKTAYDIFEETAREHPGGHVGVGVGIFKSACKPGAEIQSVVYRAMMLQLVLKVAKEQMSPWIKNGQPDSALFREMAQLPMEWMGNEVERKGFPFDPEELLRRLRGESG